jgi:hypothetical protein
MFPRVAIAGLLTTLLAIICLDRPVVAFYQSRDSNYNQNIVSSGGGCSQATTFLARTSGVSGGDQTAMTTLICGLVTDSVITGTLASSSFCGSLLDALYVFAITNATTAKLDICGHTTMTLTANGSPTFTADQGYTGTDGSSTVFLDTNVNLSTLSNFSNSSSHISVWDDSTATGSANNAIGAQNTGVNTFITAINPRFTDGNAYMRISDGASPVGGIAVADSRGYYVASRSGVSSQVGYRAVSGTVTNLGVTPTTQTADTQNENLYILCNNDAGSCTGGTIGRIMAASVGANLTLTQATNLYTRLRTYLTTVAGIAY